MSIIACLTARKAGTRLFASRPAGQRGELASDEDGEGQLIAGRFEPNRLQAVWIDDPEGESGKHELDRRGHSLP